MITITYHCDAIAVDPSVVLAIHKEELRARLEDPDLSRTWAEHLARETQRARFRCEVLSRRTVAARLDTWLGWPGNALPDKGRLNRLAFEIGVSPEALYRQLAARKRG